MVWPILGPCRPFWIKRAVRCCRRCGVAGGERVPPAPLGWYWENAQYLLRISCFLGKYSVFMLQGGNCQLICKLYSTEDTDLCNKRLILYKFLFSLIFLNKILKFLRIKLSILTLKRHKGIKLLRIKLSILKLLHKKLSIFKLFSNSVFNFFWPNSSVWDIQTFRFLR